MPPEQIREERLKYLNDEKHIKAVTVLFSDLEGRLHMLDYDKKFIVKSDDNLTFDGKLDPRLYRTKRERFAPGHRLETFIGRLQIFLVPARCWFSAK